MKSKKKIFGKVLSMKQLNVVKGGGPILVVATTDRPMPQTREYTTTTQKKQTN